MKSFDKNELRAEKTKLMFSMFIDVTDRRKKNYNL